ncbi:MAG TPA: hypothetical protein VF495_05710, partial [Phenylobacterium sp.]
CLLMAVRPPADLTVGELARHANVVGSRLETTPVILVLERLLPGRRRGLLERRAAFMVPGAQLFIPEALLDLRERIGRAPPREIERFSPVAQLVILGALLRPDVEPNSVTAVARRYGVAAMSMTRAFDELQGADLAEAPRSAKPRLLRLRTTGRDLWDRAAPRLQSPVRKVRVVAIPYPDHFPAKVAGESALSSYAALAPPRVTRLAVASSDWNQLVRNHGLRDREPGDPGADEIETWAYDPAALSDDLKVDRLSLHLSLRDHPDERVSQAADDILEQMPWW